MIQIGVIGYGYWGPNLVRNLSIHGRSQVIAVCDLNSQRLEEAKRTYPQLTLYSNFQDLLKNPKVAAIAIATPVSSHHSLAAAALRAGKHVLVEKPLAHTAKKAEELIEIAKDNKCVLMVDHTFIYTPAVQKIRELIDSQIMGDLYYYDSTRINLGLFQTDVDVIWDLAIHDLSILDYVTGKRPISISATGMNHVPTKPCNIAFLTLFYPDNMIAHINVNWLSPMKVRQTLFGGSKKMILYNDVEPSEKIKIYDRGIQLPHSETDIYQMLIKYRMGDVWAPYLSNQEALHREALEFLNCIEQNKKPITDGAMGLRLVCQLEAATASMKQNGQPVDIRLQCLAK